jgi:hypothetical protein
MREQEQKKWKSEEIYEMRSVVPTYEFYEKKNRLQVRKYSGGDII